MSEKLTMKKLSKELELLRTQMHEMEAQLRQHFDAELKSALAAVKSAPGPTGKSAAQTSIDSKQRQQLITTEAYLIAERRDFQGGDPSQDWAEAEKLVDHRLMQSGNSGQPLTDAAIRKKTGVNTPASVKP